MNIDLEHTIKFISLTFVKRLFWSLFSSINGNCDFKSASLTLEMTFMILKIIIHIDGMDIPTR